MKYTYSFYKYTDLSDLDEIKKYVFTNMKKNNIFGTILLSSEGLNCNIYCDEENFDNFFNKLKKYIPLNNIFINKSISKVKSFKKIKVKIKKEIIKFNKKILINDNDKNKLNPYKWNKILDEDIQLIDMRNNFEYSLGTFINAISLNLIDFIDLNNRHAELSNLDKSKKTAIFCTGGIRCEKAEQFLRLNGFKHVFQLEGGIVNYLNNSNETSKWLGDCFVFDDRIILE